MHSIYGEDYWGFVYIWRDRKRKKYCIGSHFGPLDDGYITSTGHMKNAYKKRPEDFTRRILYLHPHRDNTTLKAMEQRWLDLIKDDQLGLKYYNIKKTATGWQKGMPRSFATKSKISSTLRGRPKPEGFNIGRKHSDETLRKMRETAKGRDMSKCHAGRRKLIVDSENTSAFSLSAEP